jgi:hypothetical protein
MIAFYHTILLSPGCSNSIYPYPYCSVVSDVISLQSQSQINVCERKRMRELCKVKRQTAGGHVPRASSRCRRRSRAREGRRSLYKQRTAPQPARPPPSVRYPFVGHSYDSQAAKAAIKAAVKAAAKAALPPSYLLPSAETDTATSRRRRIKVERTKHAGAFNFGSSALNSSAFRAASCLPFTS